MRIHTDGNGRIMSSKFETYASDIAEAINDLEVDRLAGRPFVDLLPNGDFGEYSEPAVPCHAIGFHPIK